MFEYGARAGFWRLHRLFLERGLPYTVFACAQAIERNPPAAKAIREAGLDVCCHGWRWIEHYKLTEADEREHIPPRRRLPEADPGRRARRLVLPLRAEREHPSPHG